MKVVGIIPAHMASVRFPNKILFNIFSLPMIEHVRRRALLSKYLDDVIVTTCDKEIADTVRAFNGKVIMTRNNHSNGTSRVAEGIKSINCTHVLLLQGDEPLLWPRHIDKIVKEMKSNPNVESWNATGEINSEDELNRSSFVKCTVLKNNKILNCFRRTPYLSKLDSQRKFVRKILGIIGYKKDFLNNLNKLSRSEIEIAEFIEQMKIIEYGYNLFSVPVKPSLASINEPHEADIVLDYLKKNNEQKELLQKILKIEY